MASHALQSVAVFFVQPWTNAERKTAKDSPSCVFPGLTKAASSAHFYHTGKKNIPL
jgi:hypothetical protein